MTLHKSLHVHQTLYMNQIEKGNLSEDRSPSQERHELQCSRRRDLAAVAEAPAAAGAPGVQRAAAREGRAVEGPGAQLHRAVLPHTSKEVASNEQVLDVDRRQHALEPYMVSKSVSLAI